jgi:aminoglycoside phosphotransferase (APT) family kinase protein
MQEVIADEIGKFLENEDNRHKNVVSNLGSILAKVSAIDKFKFDEVSEAYFNEQLDRQVLWILKAVPELLN